MQVVLFAVAVLVSGGDGSVADGGVGAAWPSIEVNGFMRGRGGSMVVLNGKALDIGQKIAGAEVVAVDRSSVTLRFNGETRTLSQGQKTGGVMPVAAPSVQPATGMTAGTPAPSTNGTQGAGSRSIQGWAADLPPQLRQAPPAAPGASAQAAKPPEPVSATVSSAPAARPSDAMPAERGLAAPSPSLEEQAIAEHLKQNPGFLKSMHTQHQARLAEEDKLRKNPAVMATGGIFLPQRPPVRSALVLLRDKLEAHQTYLLHTEQKAGRMLTVNDIDANDPDGVMYVMGLFTRGTLQALQREGVEAGLRFACGFVDSFLVRRRELSSAWGEVTYEDYLTEMYWMTAGALGLAGDAAGARLTCKSALAANLQHPLIASIRYMEACAAHRSGQEYEATEILRALVEDPKCKDVPLRLPEEGRELGTVYAGSVALLEAIRRGDGKGALAIPPWAKPISVAAVHEPPTAAQEPLSPPRFGMPHVCKLGRQNNMEFVWIEPMRIWAARYELTEGEWSALMCATETGRRLPAPVSYEQAVNFCVALNRHEAKSLPAGYSYRVPTVAEWEQLARCGIDRVYPWGNAMPPTFGNYSDETVLDAVRQQGLADHYARPYIAGYRDGYEGAAPVEASGQNEWGLYGMGGNLWDWATTPTGDCMIKGGTWMHTGDMLRIDAGIAGIHNATPPGGGALRCVLAPGAVK